MPSQVYDRLEHNEPSAREKAPTAHIVPPTERGLDDQGPVDIQEIMASLGEDRSTSGGEAGDDSAPKEDGSGRPDNNGDRIHEIGSSGMFSLDCRPDIADAEKLRYLFESMGEAVPGEQTCGSAWAGSAKVRQGAPPSRTLLFLEVKILQILLIRGFWQKHSLLCSRSERVVLVRPKNAPWTREGRPLALSMQHSWRNGWCRPGT